MQLLVSYSFPYLIPLTGFPFSPFCVHSAATLGGREGARDRCLFPSPSKSFPARPSAFGIQGKVKVHLARSRSPLRGDNRQGKEKTHTSVTHHRPCHCFYASCELRVRKKEEKRKAQNGEGGYRGPEIEGHLCLSVCLSVLPLHRNVNREVVRGKTQREQRKNARAIRI